MVIWKEAEKIGGGGIGGGKKGERRGRGCGRRRMMMTEAECKVNEVQEENALLPIPD